VQLGNAALAIDRHRGLVDGGAVDGADGNVIAKNRPRARVRLFDRCAGKTGVFLRRNSTHIERNADTLQALLRSEHQLSPNETPTRAFESRRPWIKANLNWVPPFLRHGEPQPQLANVENLLAADGFIVDRHLESSITTLSIEAPFRFENSVTGAAPSDATSPATHAAPQSPATRCLC
jgi:hypothetical protein